MTYTRAEKKKLRRLRSEFRRIMPEHEIRLMHLWNEREGLYRTSHILVITRPDEGSFEREITCTICAAAQLGPVTIRVRSAAWTAARRRATRIALLALFVACIAVCFLIPAHDLGVALVFVIAALVMGGIYWSEIDNSITGLEIVSEYRTHKLG